MSLHRLVGSVAGVPHPIHPARRQSNTSLGNGKKGNATMAVCTVSKSATDVPMRGNVGSDSPEIPHHMFTVLI
jgi:hypothetical protein